MSRFLERLQNVLAAIAFAEEGEAETATRIASEGEPSRGESRDRRAGNAPPSPPPRLRAISRRKGA